MNSPSLFEQRMEIIKIRLWDIGQIFVELWKGLKRQDPILYRCGVVGVILGIIVLLQVDVWTFKRLGIWAFYPTDGWVFRLYVLVMIWAPTFGFGVWVRNDKKKFMKKLKEVFDLVGAQVFF